MGRINQDIVEYSFSSKSTLSYELNLLIGNDSIYYMVNDAQLNVLALKSFHNDRKKDKTQLSTFKDAFFEDGILKEPYRVTKIVYTTPHFTLIPNKFYNDEQRPVYFENLTNETDNMLFEADSMKNIDFKNVYAVDTPTVNFTNSIFPLAKRFHVFSALIQGCQKIAETRQGHQIFANIRDGFVQILFFDSKDLIFANAYPFHTPQDLIYYIMMVYEQFKLNPDNIPLSMSGNMTEDSDIFKYIYRYIRFVNFIPAPTYFRLGQEFTGVPQHFYFDLFSIKLCE
jgi:Protein of unknown function (DUF3822)